MLLGPNFEAYLPDANFDFEAFLSSTLGDDSTRLFAGNLFNVDPPAAKSSTTDTSQSNPMSGGLTREIGGAPSANSIYQ